MVKAGSYRGHDVLKHKHVGGAMKEQADGGGAQAISEHGLDSAINQVVSVLLMTARLRPTASLSLTNEFNTQLAIFFFLSLSFFHSLQSKIPTFLNVLLPAQQ